MNIYYITTVDALFLELLAILRLTLRGLNKMVIIFQSSCWNAFVWIKIIVFWFTYHRNLFQGEGLIIRQYLFRLLLLPEPIVTKHYDATWGHKATMRMSGSYPTKQERVPNVARSLMHELMAGVRPKPIDNLHLYGLFSKSSTYHIAKQTQRFAF